MEKYEIKGYERYKVFVTLAVLSFIFYIILNNYLLTIHNDFLKIIINFLSLGFFYLILFYLFDQFLWRLKIFHLPDLNGSWHGTLLSSYTGDDNKKTVKTCEIVIRQTFTSMSIYFKTDTSASYNMNGFLDITKSNMIRLSYEYNSSADIEAEEALKDHIGYSILLFTAGKDGLTGNGRYFNDLKHRSTFGNIKDLNRK